MSAVAAFPFWISLAASLPSCSCSPIAILVIDVQVVGRCLVPCCIKSTGSPSRGCQHLCTSLCSCNTQACGCNTIAAFLLIEARKVSTPSGLMSLTQLAGGLRGWSPLLHVGIRRGLLYTVAVSACPLREYSAAAVNLRASTPLVCRLRERPPPLQMMLIGVDSQRSHGRLGTSSPRAESSGRPRLQPTRRGAHGPQPERCSVADTPQHTLA